MINSETRGSYLVLDKIAPVPRSVLSLVLIVAGYGLQLSMRNFFVGLPFIAACLAVNLIRGIAIQKEHAAEFKWEEITARRLDEVYDHCLKIKGFKSAGIGCLIALVIVSFFFFVWVMPLVAVRNRGLPFGLTVAIIDSVILFAGLLASGNKHAWMPGNLDVKTGVIRQLITNPLFAADHSLKPVPYLELGRSKTGSFPNDARFLVKFTDAPDSFIGVQGQISINSVKSTAYPYFYTVIIARPEFGLFEKFAAPAVKTLTVEQKKTAEVDVIVIRQTTTKTSGYHTDRRAQNFILETAIAAAKKLFAGKALPT